MFNVPIVVFYMLSLCFFSSISLFYALFFQFNLLVLCLLFFCAFVLCVLFLQTTLFYMFHCFSVMPGGLFLQWNWWVIAGLTHQCHCGWSLWAGSEYIAPFLRVKALGKFRFVLRFSGIFSFCLSLALFRPKALLQGWFLKNLEL